MAHDRDRHGDDVVGDGKRKVLPNEPAGASRDRRSPEAPRTGSRAGNTRSAALRPTSAAEAGAIDACAAASAGVSFNPSPTIRTFRPEASSAAMCAVFPPGSTAAKMGTPSSAAISRTGDLAIAGNHLDQKATVLQLGDRRCCIRPQPVLEAKIRPGGCRPLQARRTRRLTSRLRRAVPASAHSGRPSR